MQFEEKKSWMLIWYRIQTHQQLSHFNLQDLTHLREDVTSDFESDNWCWSNCLKSLETKKEMKLEPSDKSSSKSRFNLNGIHYKSTTIGLTFSQTKILNYIKDSTLVYKTMAPVQQQKMSPVAKQKSPLKKSNSHNIKLYDFNFNMIHFILNFYNKYLVVV